MISVIVPVYNRERTLPICVESILNANYHDLEVILVDDGSSDNSLNICMGYATRDSRVRVVKQQNMGVSSARNHGIDVAVGDWVSFVDSDDAVAPEHFDVVMSEKAEETDLMQVKYVHGKYVGGRIVLCEVHNEEPKDLFYESPEILPFIFGTNNPYKNFFYFCHDKFFRRDILNKYNIRFPNDVSLGEDQIFVCKYLQYTMKYIYRNAYTCYRLGWMQSDRSYQLTTKERTVEEYLYDILKNYNAINNLYLESGRGFDIKKYAVSYLLSRPFSFFVNRNMNSLYTYCKSFKRMKKGMLLAKKNMLIEKENVKMLDNWQLRLLCECVFSVNVSATLWLAYFFYIVNYVKEGMKYRVCGKKKFIRFKM